MQPDGLEAALITTAARIDAAAKASVSTTRELKKASGAASSGSIKELRKALDAAVQASGVLGQLVLEAEESYSLNETEHLASGRYTKELLEAAAEQGVAMFAEDDRLLCYPSLIRVLPADVVIQIDKRREKRLRPSVVVGLLAAGQNRPPSKTDPTLESMAEAYELLAEREDKTDPVVRLDAIWKVLTLRPGQARDYTIHEFARDLYLLDQSGRLTTKAGRTLRFHASSGTRGAGVLTTVAKTGQQQRYWGVSFTAR